LVGFNIFGEFCAPGLNLVDGVDVIHIKGIGVRFEIEASFRTAAQLLKKFGT